LSLILSWGVFTFYWTNPGNWFQLISIFLIGVVCLFLIWREYSPVFILLFLSFTSSYSFNVFLAQMNLPVWLIMVALLIIFGYLFIYLEQKIGILGNKRLIYLILFSLITLEIFLSLTYFLISPISQSLIIATTSYLFVGFCYTILAKHVDNKFSTYLIISGIVILLVFLTSSWGGGLA